MSHNSTLFFEPIPSEPIELGWGNFVKNIPSLIGRDMSTEKILPLLHRLVTFGISHQQIPKDIAETIVYTSLMLAGTDFASINDLKSRHMKEVRKRVRALTEGKSCPPINIIGVQDVGNIFQGPLFIPEKIEVRPSMLRRGHLRSFGQTEASGKKKKLFVAHDTPLFWKGKDLGYSYKGLEDGLDEVYRRLCKEFDSIMRDSSSSPREKLKAIVFFQVFGSILHPFFDANGRVLLTHCILELNKMGFPVKTIPTLGEIDEILEKNIFASIGGHLIHVFLEVENIPLLEVNKGKVSRSVYMQSLKKGLLKCINEGIEGNNEFMPYIEGGVELLMCWLSRERVIPGDNGELYIKKSKELRDEFKK